MAFEELLKGELIDAGQTDPVLQHFAIAGKPTYVKAFKFIVKSFYGWRGGLQYIAIVT